MLLRKHEAFEKTVSAQMGKIEELEKFGAELLAKQHYDSMAITQRLQAVAARRDRLKESAAARRLRLLQSRQLHQFLRNMYEVRMLLVPKSITSTYNNYFILLQCQGQLLQ